MSSVVPKLVLCFCLVAIVLLVIVGVCGFRKWINKTKYEQCPETNETFIVQNNKNEPEWISKEVALRLSRLARKADKVVNYMYENQLPNKMVSERLYLRWNNIRKNPKGFRETSFGEKSAAYTVNKGDELRICIRDPDSNEMFESENTGFLVLLHELAHLMSQSFGHNIEFKKNFAYICKQAQELGLYRYVDYSKNPTSYCSTDITHSPF